MLWIVPVATNWYHISGVMAAVQVPGCADVVAVVKRAVELDVHPCPPLTVNVLAAEHSSFTGGKGLKTVLFLSRGAVPPITWEYCKIRHRQHSRVIFFIGWYLFLKIC
jgi:hypothetical protein